MDARLANSWQLTVNEEKFIVNALASELRVDGRNPWEYRKLTISFGKVDGSVEVQLGQTRAMAIVTGQLVRPYRDRPNEGSLSIFTEFSPMADPSFEPGRPGEFAVELGRIIDRGLRESRAVDLESLCVLSGELVWGIRIDLHILDNGGNLVDTANVAALAALMVFRRPECTMGGEDDKEVIVHPPEAREPLPLIIHHLPISVTFAFFGGDGIMVIDPTYQEEAVMGGRMTVTVNENGDICAIQKAGGDGVQQSVIMRCLRLASRNAESIAKKIRDAVGAYNTERALGKIKRRLADVSSTNCDMKDKAMKYEGIEISMEKFKIISEDSSCGPVSTLESGSKLSESGLELGKRFLGGASKWDPYSEGADAEFLKTTLCSQGLKKPNKKDAKNGPSEDEVKLPDGSSINLAADDAVSPMVVTGKKTLKDAVKPKHRRRLHSSLKSS